MKFLECWVYLVLVGAVGFLAGRILPRKWFRPDSGLYRCFVFEKNGKIYEKLGIRKWQKKLPDMSRILPFIMPAKNLSGNYAGRLPVMIQETCVAEFVHTAVSLAGTYCLRLWPGTGGVVVTLINILLFNLPFILIQRYNRPRLIRLQRKLCRIPQQEENTLCACG